jgi:ribose transport system substrate-binding protein
MLFTPLRRRLPLVAAVAAVALTAVGCGSSSSSGGGAATTRADPTGRFTIGYDVYWLGNSWSTQLAEEFRAAVDRNRDSIENVVYTQSDNQVQKQISNVQSMISRRVDAIIMTPISPSASVPVIQQANRAGIPVILVAAQADTRDTAAEVRADDVVFGRTGAEWLVDKLGGRGNIYVLNGLPGFSTDTLRWKGAKDVFDRYPDIKVVADAHAAWDTARAKTAVSNMLAAHPDVDGVWSQGGAMTLGAIQAFRAAGHPLVPMTGENNNGLMKVWDGLIRSGDRTFDSIGVVNPTWVGSEALTQTLNLLRGDEVRKVNLVNPAPITSSTLDRYVRTDLPDSFWVDTRLDDAQIRALFDR